MDYILFISLFVAGPAGYLLVTRSYFYLRYGLVKYRSVRMCVRVAPVLSSKAAGMLSHVADVLRDHMLEVYIMRLKDAGYNTKMMKRVIGNTDISIQRDIYWQGVRAVGKAEWSYCMTQIEKRNVVLLNLAVMMEKNMRAHEIAQLIFHELVHHYLMLVEDDPDGKRFKGNHNHSIWKILN